MKFFISKLLLLLCILNLSAQTEELELIELPLRTGGTELYAQNNGHAPLTIEMNLKIKNNVRTDQTLPHQVVIPVGDEPMKVLTITPINPRKDSRYEYEFTYVVGDINAKHDDDFAYLLPFRNGTSATITQGYNGSFSHRGLYCLDFDLDIGTKVYAARGGTVVSVKENSNTGCKSSRCKGLSNHIVICHEDGTMANYIHLKYNGSDVVPGQKIKAGQHIGYSGNTGWSSGPHLHFEVFVPGMNFTKSIPTKFLTEEQGVSELREKENYKAVHPQG